MSEFKIEKGIPVPGHGAVRSKYPFDAMLVGESFLVGPPTTLAQVSRAASKAGARMGRKFATRTVEGGVRVWRIA